MNRVGLVLLGILLTAIIGLAVVTALYSIDTECRLNDCYLPNPEFLSYKEIHSSTTGYPPHHQMHYYAITVNGTKLEITKDKYNSLYWLEEK